MATFPPSIGSPSAPPPQGGGATQGATPNMNLALLGDVIKKLAIQYPQAQQGIKMMLDGLRQVQASASANSAPQQPAAPPR